MSTSTQRQSRILGPRTSRTSFDHADARYPLAHRPSIATISTVSSDDSDASTDSPPAPSPRTPPRRRQGSPHRSARRRPLPLLPSDVPPVPALPAAYASPLSPTFRRLPVLPASPPAHHRAFSDVRVLPVLPERSYSPEPRTSPPLLDSDASDPEIDWDMIDEILGCAA